MPCPRLFVAISLAVCLILPTRAWAPDPLELVIKVDGSEKIGDVSSEHGAELVSAKVEQRLDSPDTYSFDLQIVGTDAQNQQFIDDLVQGKKIGFIVLDAGEVRERFPVEQQYVEPPLEGDRSGGIRLTVKGTDPDGKLSGDSWRRHVTVRPAESRGSGEQRTSDTR